MNGYLKTMVSQRSLPPLGKGDYFAVGKMVDEVLFNVYIGQSGEMKQILRNPVCLDNFIFNCPYIIWGRRGVRGILNLDAISKT